MVSRASTVTEPGSGSRVNPALGPNQPASEAAGPHSRTPKRASKMRSSTWRKSQNIRGAGIRKPIGTEDRGRPRPRPIAGFGPPVRLAARSRLQGQPPRCPARRRRGLDQVRWASVKSASGTGKTDCRAAAGSVGPDHERLPIALRTDMRAGCRGETGSRHASQRRNSCGETPVQRRNARVKLAAS